MNVTSLAGLLQSLIDRAQPEWKKSQAALRRRFVEETSLALAEEHVRASNWSQEIHGLQLDASADTASVDLSFRSIPRRVGIDGQSIDELDILHGTQHFTILGDPGAGKTTTLRRLADHVAHQPGRNSDDEFRCVIVVVCREETWKNDDPVYEDQPLYRVLAKKAGVNGQLAEGLDNPGLSIRRHLDFGALIIIDGLDEIPIHNRADVERDITDLGRYLRRSKIVVSCRSGDYVMPLEGFDTAEIEPLTPEQIRRVVEQVLGPEQTPRFHEAIHNAGAAAQGLANRPLFLIAILQIFQRRGTIPDRPTNLYESLTRLIIQDWDEQRRVRRSSRYESFGVDDKRRFLADLAYQLISLHLLRFGEAELMWAYTELAERYDLPRSEARQVARELEAHTGLLVQSGDSFEFSHLSLQEFLAADSMVRGAPSAHTRWWSTHPEVAAVASALAQDPNIWIAQLVEHLPQDIDDVRPLHAFLRRLGHERPRFVRSPDLGDWIIDIVSRARIQSPDTVSDLGDVQGVRGSVVDVLATFDAICSKGDEIHLTRHLGHSPASTYTFTVATPVLEMFVGREQVNQILTNARR